jgi:hypothetical protein
MTRIVGTLKNGEKIIISCEHSLEKMLEALDLFEAKRFKNGRTRLMMAGKWVHVEIYENV